MNDIINNIGRSFVNRATIIKQFLKYPEVEDFKTSLQTHDEKTLQDIKNGLLDLLNSSRIINDLLTKNYDKIVKPKEEIVNISMY